MGTTVERRERDAFRTAVACHERDEHRKAAVAASLSMHVAPDDRRPSRLYLASLFASGQLDKTLAAAALHCERFPDDAAARRVPAAVREARARLASSAVSERAARARALLADWGGAQPPSSSSPGVEGRPAVFADLSFDAAVARAQETGRLLLVDMTAAWCAPCKAMDKTTWSAPSLVEHLQRDTIAIQVDVDVDKAIAARFEVSAMPTVLALRDGVCVDRVVGAQSAPQVLAWMEGLARGVTALDAARAEAAGKPTDVPGRMKLMRRLMQSGALAEAMDEVLWLWMNMLAHEPALRSVKHSSFKRDVEELVARHPPAREAFVRLRDEAAPPAGDGDPDGSAFQDWSTLNAVLGDEEHILAWFDARGRRAPIAESAAVVVEHVVFPLLVEAERWADAGALVRDPMRVVTLHREATSLAERDRGAHAEAIRRIREDRFRTDAQQMLTALRAAERIDEAARLAEAVREIDPSDEAARVLE